MLTGLSTTLTQDDIPEVAETFLVRITNVTLADGTLGQDSLSPRALPGAENAEIQINENDNARGILNFDVDLVSCYANMCPAPKLL